MGSRRRRSAPKRPHHGRECPEDGNNTDWNRRRASWYFATTDGGTFFSVPSAGDAQVFLTSAFRSAGLRGRLPFSPNGEARENSHTAAICWSFRLGNPRMRRTRRNGKTVRHSGARAFFAIMYEPACRCVTRQAQRMKVPVQRETISSGYRIGPVRWMSPCRGRIAPFRP